MAKFLNNLFLILIFPIFVKTYSQDSTLFNTYPSIMEKTIFYKKGRMKAFYGGPIDRKDKGVRWLMPISFEDYTNKTRAVYEVSFINCDLSNAHDAEILFVEVIDIDIKFKNRLSKNYSIFSSLLNGEYKDGKYVVIRFADVAHVFYPDIFIFSEYGKRIQFDKTEIVKFLHEHFKVADSYKDFFVHEKEYEISYENADEVVYCPLKVEIDFGGIIYPFAIVKRIKKNDIWKVYYVISKDANINPDNDILLRIDSGCVSGQIYDDDACDCLDQLHNALKQLAQEDSNNGVIIHIPCHDGRGFGTAPKAETEIYKRGGKGRIHSTMQLDTVTAAKLLYGVGKYDLRSYDGVAEILRAMNIKRVILLTDNIEKVETMQRHGLEVLRQKTGTNKSTCISHIRAKKDSAQYFSE